MQKVRDILTSFILENYVIGRNANKKLTPDESLLESGFVDSTGILELVLFLEEQFSVKIEDEEIVPENLDTINNLVAFLDRKMIRNSQAV